MARGRAIGLLSGGARTGGLAAYRLDSVCRVATASVVIPTRGGATRLPTVLAALASQTHADTEVVVVLDGDIDESAQVARTFADRLDLQVIEFPENRGRSAALSAGFQAATGRVLIRCDDDLEPPQTHVERHVAHHAGEPVGIIGMCPDVFPAANAYGRVYGVPVDQRLRRDAYALAPQERWRLWSANVSVTRETYDRVGPYDDAFRAYGWEDIDWGYRLHRLGVPIRIPDDIEMDHHNPPLTVRERAERALASGRSRRFFEAKHGLERARVVAGTGVWDRAVGTLAGRLTDEASVGRYAAPVDRMLPRLPAPVGHKLAALVIEAAGRAALSD